MYGINYRSILNQSRYFHVIGGLPGDAMHDILEGVLQYECKELLKYTINGMKYFSLDQLNQWIKDFDYGYPDASNKPSIISSVTLNSTSNSLKQRASQMWCLGRFLPLLIGAHVPCEDEKWKLYITLLEILDIVFSPCIEVNKASYLADLIEEHHSMFVQLYPNASVIPKMHYLIHYPRTMLRLGPMVRTWCMRFEAKHGRLKKLASSIGNFTNIAWSMADRHQLRQCYEYTASNHGQPLIEKPIELGAGTQKEAQTTGYLNFLQEQVPDLRLDEIVHETTWCKVHGTKYRQGAIVHTGYDGVLPKFSVVEKICFLSERPLNDNNLLFVIKDIPTLNFEAHFHAFRVGNVSPNIAKVIRQSRLISYRPMHVNKPIQVAGMHCVCPKLDVDIYNEQI